MSKQDCERFVELLGEYFDGVLDVAGRDAVEHHRASCSECDALAAGYDRIPDLARRATDVVMPAGARARLRRLLAHAWRRRP